MHHFNDKIHNKKNLNLDYWSSKYISSEILLRKPEFFVYNSLKVEINTFAKEVTNLVYIQTTLW